MLNSSLRARYKKPSREKLTWNNSIKLLAPAASIFRNPDGKGEGCTKSPVSYKPDMLLKILTVCPKILTEKKEAERNESSNTDSVASIFLVRCSILAHSLLRRNGCCSFNQRELADQRHSYPKGLEAWRGLA